MARVSKKVGQRVRDIGRRERVSGGRIVRILLACGCRVRRPASDYVPRYIECPNGHKPTVEMFEK